MRKNITVVALCLVLLVAAAVVGTVMGSWGANEGTAAVSSDGSASGAPAVAAGSVTPILDATTEQDTDVYAKKPPGKKKPGKKPPKKAKKKATD